jgi:RNA polymerase Rpb4
LMGRVLRNDVDLHKFEIAQLGSLCPEESEEAKTLIPRYVNPPHSACLPAFTPIFLAPHFLGSVSLPLLGGAYRLCNSLVSKKSDEELQHILDELSNLRKFQ